ncbi:amidohydrolase [Salinirubrum litoreum]|uniref:5-methylthioadenosine/S-adenosylhomocysteine deaminase n=1 Tax=Salinirubrum litoreum TaxID=1126234 RepID=A0ABD5RD73_9EURY|nr:amidohydrolase [Salinirubrum litoreum]
MTTLLIAGGRVLRPDLTVERADVLVDREAGEILAVEPNLAADRDTEETLSAEGGLVVPGLVNAHGHGAMTLLRGYADDKPLDAWLQEDIWPVEGVLTPEDVRAGTDLALLELIRSGTTGFADMYFHVGEVAEAVDAAGLRGRLGHGVVTIGKDEEAAQADVDEGIEMAREYDETADGRVTTALMPHAPHTVGSEYLDQLATAADDLGVPIHFHLNETQEYVDAIDAETGQRPVDYADDHGLLREDTWVAHGVHLTAEEIGTLAETDTSVVHCPASNMKLASGMAPVQTLLDAGVGVGLGTDGAASNNDLDAFDEVRDAAMLGKLAADDAAAVPAEAVVEMATAGSADALGFDSGRIDVGANADLAVLDLDAAHLTPAHDLVSHLAYAVRGSDVRHTVCDGDVLMRDREVLTLDAEAVRRRAREAASAAVDRVE